jgi:hypothetical protein
MPKIDRDDVPAGWTLIWGVGWPLLSHLANSSNPPRVNVGNVTVPATFYLQVAPDPKVAGEGTTILLGYLAQDEEVRLTDVLATGIEVPQALDILRKERPMEWWKRYVFMHMVFDVTREAVGEPPDDAAGDDAWFTAMGATLLDAFNVPITQRRKRLTDSHLAKVAEAYRVAWQAGTPPTKAVAQDFTVSHSTAARWVGAARKAGHLGPADSSRGGEQPQPKQPTKRGTKS